ncbi:hypothetical protein MJO28_010719 [Puccinia striiformis f. sp. tritici]|uniref:Uncharacterized protein n=1 Tax=Puccinia striiformis f. sp. tritici TaxID=168172 RepID=A0ACC0E6X0_9BASI|nr:hypothetical protein MJO28_010719 [Puccinia striiformis f. sp. tritici]
METTPIASSAGQFPQEELAEGSPFLSKRGPGSRQACSTRQGRGTGEAHRGERKTRRWRTQPTIQIYISRPETSKGMLMGELHPKPRMTLGSSREVASQFLDTVRLTIFQLSCRGGKRCATDVGLLDAFLICKTSASMGNSLLNRN